MDNNKVGEYIKTKRKEQNLTQGELALKLDVSHQAVSRWEKGDNLPDVEKLSELANLFHVTIDFIVKIGSDEEQELVDDSNLNFFTLINGVLCTIALILYYVLLMTTLKFWIPVLVQYLLVIGFSFLYIIPYSKIKTRKDFVLVRYSLLISLGSVLLSASSLFLNSVEFGTMVIFFFIGAIVTSVILFFLNIVLIKFEMNTYGVLPKTDKNSSDILIERIMVFIGFVLLASVLSAITGYTLSTIYGSLNNNQFAVSNGFVIVLQLFAIPYTILIIFQLYKTKYYENLVLAFLWTGSIIYYIYYSSYTNITISNERYSMLSNLTTLVGVVLFISFIGYIIYIAYLLVRQRAKYKTYIKNSLSRVIALILYFLTFALSTNTMSIDFNTNTWVINAVYENSVFFLTMVNAIVIYEFYSYFKSKKITLN